MTASGTDLGGAVLVGGASRRMGSDKALLDVGGQPMVRRVADALRGAGARRVVAVGRSSGPVGAGVDDWIDDLVPGGGPMIGLLTALDHLDTSYVAVLSCDLPGASATEVRRLARSAMGGDVEVALSVVDGVDQPLHAVWDRAVSAELSEAVAAGERSVRRFVTTRRCARVEPVDPRSVHDIDTPAELRAFVDDR